MVRKEFTGGQCSELMTCSAAGGGYTCTLKAPPPSPLQPPKLLLLLCEWGNVV